MRKLFSLIWLVLLAASLAHAQTTAVSATVTDPNGGAYANGTWLVTFVPNPNSAVPPTLNGAPFTKQFNGTTDATGAFTVTLADNTIVNPQGSQWIFQICSFGSTCFQYQTAVSGTTLNLSSALHAHSSPIVGNTLLNARGFQPSDIGLKIVAAQGQSACLLEAFDPQGNQIMCLSGTGTLTCVSGCGGSGGNTVGPGTVNTFAYFNAPTTVATGPISFDPINNITFSANPYSQPASLYPCINSASGTTNGLLVTRDANGNCINNPNGNQNNIRGVVSIGGGTSGIAQICKIGVCSITLDNTSVINDCIVAATTGAEGHDAGPVPCPTGIQQIGLATSVNGGAHTSAQVDVFIFDVEAGPSGPVQTVQVNGVTVTGINANFNNTTPAAQANFLNCFFQTDNGTPQSNISIECPQATSSQNGFVRLAGDLSGGSAAAPTVTGIQTIPVTFTSIAARDVLCFPTTSTLANCQLGVPVRTVAGNSDTIVAADRVTDVRYTAASGATPVTIAQAGSTGFAFNFTALLTNAQTAGTVTLTPTVSTINGASSLAIPAGNYCFIYSDNSNYTANCGQISGTGGGTVTGTGTANTMTKWTGVNSIGNSSVTDDGTNPTRAPNGLNTAVQGNYDEWTVDTGGVTANKLACRSSSNKAQICATSTTQGVLGVALTTQTNGQTVAICWAAKCSVVPSNNTTAGHWLIPSTSVAGDVDDTGSTTQPVGTQTFLAESSVTAPAVVATTILSPDAIAAAAGGRPFTLEVNGTATGIVGNLNASTPAPGAGFLAITFASSTSGNTTSIIGKVPIQGTDTNLMTAGTVSGTGASLCTDANGGATTSGCSGGSTPHPLVFSYGDPGNAVAIAAAATSTDYMTVPTACTINAWNLLIDGGTITVKFWKVATGTAIPTAGNSINTSGVSISSGTAIHSTTLTDFTSTTVSANDIMAMNVITNSGAKFVSATLGCQ